MYIPVCAHGMCLDNSEEKVRFEPPQTNVLHTNPHHSPQIFIAYKANKFYEI